MLLIFLIVLGVIAKWVVPPVSKVLAEREAMLAKTAADNRKAAEQVAAAQADYDEAMAGARGEASSIRDEARTEGRKVVDEKRAEASGEVADTLQSAELGTVAADRVAAPRASSNRRSTVCRPRWPAASSASTSRPLRWESLMSTFIGQLIGFAIIVWIAVKYVVPPVRTMMKKQQDAVRAALDESAAAADEARQTPTSEHAKAVEDARPEAPRSPRRRAPTRPASPAAAASRPRSTPNGSRPRANNRSTCCVSRPFVSCGSLGAGVRAEGRGAGAQHVDDPAAQSATVDRFLDELDEMAPSTAVLEAGATLNLRAASRDALAELVRKFDQVADGPDSAG